MEEYSGNNGNSFIKGLTIILTVLVGLFIYRTELLNNEVASLTETVNQLYGRIDSLQMQSLVNAPAPARVASPVAHKPRAIQPAASSSGSVGRVAVTAKVKVDNRYVMGTTYLPKVSTGPTGVVMINVTMDRVGIMSEVSLNHASTISDEDIIDACKEAALKTSFGYNPEASSKSTGTITYTFTSR